MLTLIFRISFCKKYLYILLASIFFIGCGNVGSSSYDASPYRSIFIIKSLNASNVASIKKLLVELFAKQGIKLKSVVYPDQVSCFNFGFDVDTLTLSNGTNGATVSGYTKDINRLFRECIELDYSNSQIAGNSGFTFVEDI